MVHIYQEKLNTQFNGESMHEQNTFKCACEWKKSRHLKGFWGHFIFFIFMYNQL